MSTNQKQYTNSINLDELIILFSRFFLSYIHKKSRLMGRTRIAELVI